MARARRPQRRRRRQGLGALVVWVSVSGWLVGPLLGALPAAAQDGRDAPAAGEAAPAAKNAAPAAEKAVPNTAAPSVHLDQLLKLPDKASYTMDKRGGLSRGEWRDLFQQARGRLTQQKKALAAAQAKMDEVARGKNPWKVGPAIPGFSGNDSDAPMDYQLQQEIKQRRQAVHDLEEQLRQLNIKADLAGVPEDWRS